MGQVLLAAKGKKGCQREAKISYEEESLGIGNFYLVIWRICQLKDAL